MKTQEAREVVENVLEIYGAYGSQASCFGARNEDEHRLRRRRLRRTKLE